MRTSFRALGPKALVALGIALAIEAAAAAPAPGASVFVERLDAGHRPFREDFDKSRGRARLVAILSPT